MQFDTDDMVETRESLNVTGYYTEDAYRILSLITDPVEFLERLAVLDLAEGLLRIRECEAISFHRFWRSLSPQRQAGFATAACAAIPTDRSLGQLLGWLYPTET
jgi:hypothetical protein